MRHSLLTLVLFTLFAAPVQAQQAGAGAVPGGTCSTPNLTRVTDDADGNRRGVILICDGSQWVVAQPTFTGACFDGDFVVYDSTTGGLSCNILCDSIPNFFEFTDVADQTVSTPTTSNILPITGTDAGCNVNVSISGGGGPEYRICSDSLCGSLVENWTSSNTTHDMNGRFLQVRATSASTDDTAVDVTINVGAVSDSWRVDTTSTGPCGSTPTIGQVCSDNSVYAGISPDGNRHMYVARCDVGMSWSVSSCAGTRSLLHWNDGNTNWTPPGTVDNSQGENNTAALIVTDSNNVDTGVQEHEAAQACADYDDGNGNTDWYLPAREEMDVIYENLVDGSPNDDNPDPVISGFNITGAEYWTSTESNSQSGVMFRFNSGFFSSRNKDGTRFVRCARKQ